MQNILVLLHLTSKNIKNSYFFLPPLPLKYGLILGKENSELNCGLLIFWVYLILQFCFLYEIAGIQNREHQTFVMISHSLQLSEKYKQDFKIYEGCFSWFYMDINFSRLIRNLQYPFNLIHIFLTNPTHKFYINHILIKFYPFLSLNV